MQSNSNVTPFIGWVLLVRKHRGQVQRSVLLWQESPGPPLCLSAWQEAPAYWSRAAAHPQACRGNHHLENILDSLTSHPERANTSEGRKEEPVTSLLMLSTDTSFSLARKLELLPLKRSLSTPSLWIPSSSASRAWACVKQAGFILIKCND